MTLGIRYAARSDVGMLREGNEDSAYAGARLLVVADGMGGHVGGEIASAAAVDTLRKLDTDVPAQELLSALEHAVREANTKLHSIVEGDPSLQGMGTTLTAMLWSGSHVALVHIGDSRAYLLRKGELFQITHDHTLVQSLVGEGRITLDEAASHPQRSLLLRALDGRGEVDPDLALREATVGDRYLLCSDGLSGVVSAETIHHVLTTQPDPELVIRQLIDLANRGGGPDNITCVVADVVDLDAPQPPLPARPVVAGAAAVSVPGVGAPTRAGNTPAQRAAEFHDTLPQPALIGGELPPHAPGPMQGMPPAGPPPGTAPQPAAAPVRHRRRWTWLIVATGLVLVMLGGAGYVGYSAINSDYYIGEHNGLVTVFRGSPQNIFGFQISSPAGPLQDKITVADLTTDAQQRVRANTTVNGGKDKAVSLAEAYKTDICQYVVVADGVNVVIKQSPGVTGCSGRTVPGTPAVKLSDLLTKDQDDIKKGAATVKANSAPAAQQILTRFTVSAQVCTKTTIPRPPDCPPIKGH